MTSQRIEAPITIAEAVDKILDKQYLLPAIQREYEWEADRTESLFDSLMRGYPMGAFLFWKVTAENSQKFRFYRFMEKYHALNHKHLEPHDIHAPRELTVVLDGQQRLTSFTIGVHGTRAERSRYGRHDDPMSYPERRLYLSLAGPYSGDAIDRVYDFQFLTKEEAANAGKQWVLVAHAMKLRSGNDVDFAQFLEYQATYKLSSWGSKALLLLCSRLIKEPVIHFFQESEQELDRVLNIFIRLNSGGVKLSFSDLLLSVATAQWTTRDARTTIFGLVAEINNEGGFDFEKDFVLKSALVLNDLVNIKFSVQNFDKANTQAIEENWDAKVRTPLLLAARLVAFFGYNAKSLTSHNALIPIAYYLMVIKADDRFITAPSQSGNRALIHRWLVASLLKSVFGAKADTILAAARAVIRANAGTNFPLPEIEQALLHPHGISLKFNDDEITELLRTSYGKRNCFSVMSMLYPPSVSGFQMHLDHCFPKSSFTKARMAKAGVKPDDIVFGEQHCDDIPNLQMLLGLVNQSKLASPFADWIKPIRAKPNEWANYQLTHAMPDLAAYAPEDFRTFFDARHSLLKARLKAALGSSTPDAV